MEIADQIKECAALKYKDENGKIGYYRYYDWDDLSYTIHMVVRYLLIHPKIVILDEGSTVRRAIKINPNHYQRDQLIALIKERKVSDVNKI